MMVQTASEPKTKKKKSTVTPCSKDLITIAPLYAAVLMNPFFFPTELRGGVAKIASGPPVREMLQGKIP
jgi:hypothetical protein